MTDIEIAFLLPCAVAAAFAIAAASITVSTAAAAAVSELQRLCQILKHVDQQIRDAVSDEKAIENYLRGKKK